MLKISKIIIACLLVLSPFSLFAQNNTNSPYSRFGLGELGDRSFGAGRAMGGIGYGLRSSKQINPMNPASYTSIDSMTFIMDFGVAGQVSWFNDGMNKQTNVNGNLEYVSILFPVTKRIAVSAGILPFSYVGYDYGTAYSNEPPYYYDQFIGKGGLNDFYVGLSIELWKKRLSVGGNFGYLFGNITHDRYARFVEDGAYSTTSFRRLDVRDFKMDLGVQYTHPLSKTENVTIGVAFSPKSKLNLESTIITTTASADTTIIKGQAYDIPTSIGTGVSYTKRDKVVLGADFLFENWSDARFANKKGDYRNRMKVAVGGEYLPDFLSRSFFKRVRYRGGLHYSNSYVKITEPQYNLNGKGYKEYGASVGLGLPLVDGRSFLNLSFEYVNVSAESRPLIDEQYFRFTVNYTFNERWFFKFKVD